MPNSITVARGLIAHCEGCRLAPYQDLRGLWTIGFGNRSSVDGSPVTRDTQPLQMYQAAALLTDTLVGVTAPKLATLIEMPTSDCEMGALISLAYNIGTTAFAGSTMLRWINRGRMDLAGGRFGSWVYAGGKRIQGLVARRALERSVFLGLVDPVRFLPVRKPTLPHPLLASTKPTATTADQLNDRVLLTLKAAA